MVVVKHDTSGHVLGCFLTQVLNLFSAKSIFINIAHCTIHIQPISNQFIGIIIPTASNAIENQNTRLFINKKRRESPQKHDPKTTQTALKMKIFCATYD